MYLTNSTSSDTTLSWSYSEKTALGTSKVGLRQHYLIKEKEDFTACCLFFLVPEDGVTEESLRKWIMDERFQAFPLIENNNINLLAQLGMT